MVGDVGAGLGGVHAGQGVAQGDALVEGGELDAAPEGGLADEEHGHGRAGVHVGRSDVLFSDDALALVHQVSRGLPRAVNNLAIQSLVAAYASGKAIVDESSARAAIAEVTAE